MTFVSSEEAGGGREPLTRRGKLNAKRRRDRLRRAVNARLARGAVALWPGGQPSTAAATSKRDSLAEHRVEFDMFSSSPSRAKTQTLARVGITISKRGTPDMRSTTATYCDMPSAAEGGECHSVPSLPWVAVAWTKGVDVAGPHANWGCRGGMWRQGHSIM